MSDFTGALPTNTEPADDTAAELPTFADESFADEPTDAPALNEHGLPAAPKTTYGDVPDTEEN